MAFNEMIRKIFDVIVCGLITIWQLIKGILLGFIIAILIQIIVYYLSGKKISLINILIRWIKKEIYSDQTIISLKK